MPYAPGITYNPGPIYEGAAEGARLMVQGSQEAGRGISRGIEALGQGAKDYMMTKQELDFLDGQAQQLQKAGAMTVEDLQKFHETSMGGKRAIVSQAAATLDFNNKLKLFKAEHEKQKWQPTVSMLDDGTGRKVPVLMTSPQSAVPLKGFNETQPDLTEITMPGGERIVWDKRSGKPVPYSAVISDRAKPDVLAEASSAADNQKIADNDQQIAAYAKEMAAGHKRFGAGWFGREDYSQKIADLQAENKSLMDKMTRARGGRPAAGSGSPPMPGKKTLTPQVAADYLRKTDGDRKKAQAMAAEDGYTEEDNSQ